MRLYKRVTLFKGIQADVFRVKRYDICDHFQITQQNIVICVHVCLLYIFTYIFLTLYRGRKDKSNVAKLKDIQVLTVQFFQHFCRFKNFQDNLGRKRN